MPRKVPFTRLFALFMPLFYLALAAMLAFTRLFDAYATGYAAWIFAGLFFLYAVYRIWRLTQTKDG